MLSPILGIPRQCVGHRGTRPLKLGPGLLSADHPLLELIRARCTAESFEAGRELSEETIRALVADATCAPSSFNLQHWRFVAVRRAEDRDKLCAAAFGQQQVKDAAVTFIVLGDLRATERLPQILDPAVARGALPEAKAAAWVRMAREIYADPTTARDEAIRSASLAAMTLMLAARARGLASAALSGFDPARVMREFGIGERYLPVMLLSIGPATGPASSRMPRLEVDEVLEFDRWSATPRE